MRRILVLAMLAVFPVVAVQAQPALTEPPEFPMGIPGPSAQPAGGGCFLLARGTIAPGDVDWLRVTIPWPSSQTIVDVDFPTNGTIGSALTASVVGGSSGFNIADNNVARDAVCGLSATSSPVGSTRDSAISLGATARNAAINIGVTGAEDTGFTGAHSRTFTYDLWVSTVPTVCIADAGCNDNVACTVDRCTVATGLCTNTPTDSLCDNGRFCDGLETCSATLGCRAGAAPSCDDVIDCTFDRCDLNVDACAHVPDHDACDDGLPCDGVEWCDTQSGCQDDVPMDCDDGVACTDDTCDDASGVCAHAPVNARCDDGRFCNGVESCDATLGCRLGTAPSCDDAVACTADRCNAATDRCESTADHARCDDGLFCDGAERCDIRLGCLPGTPVDCNDTFDCTADRCDEPSDRCVHAGDNARCDDGLFCNGAESCHATQGCVVGAAPCSGGACSEEDGACAGCANDADCDDKDFCNGAETCDESGACVNGKPPCAEGETCDPTTGECESQQGMTFDFQPRRCPNRVSGEEQLLTAAIVSVGGFDVREIRLRSLKLSRVDGMGDFVSPILEGRGQRPSVEDVTSPYLGDACGCSLSRVDGVKDLVIRFDGDEAWKGLKLGRTRRGQTVQVKLTGQLRDGTAFELNDCVSVGHGTVSH